MSGTSSTKGILTRVHVNQHVARANKKNGTDHPAITIKSSKGNRYANRVTFDGEWTLISSPLKPLSCGATLWVEGYDNGTNLHAE